MQTVPIFPIVAADAGVRAVFGESPTRVFPFSQAPAGGAKPYATWQLITGEPESYLADAPDIDSATIQLDIYADSVDECRAGLVALRDVIERHAVITRWGDEDIDGETGLQHRSFDVDWWVPR
ncbi:tail completion protein gp17 [Salinicola rhizosphaerae]|uniref:DUF3168 domain-containing protein n=1 Tax=Salinicola rhizosphaerae TaxID=1443141 RepID=A0ABQ3E8W6_9GAMM|nr:DUF3168 domain-containing protein [Salinicola rhizosphaerae]GHB30471.1 hypothetical protein GCM10009038_31570 [Salinicola rhizosphaerae]